MDLIKLQTIIPINDDVLNHKMENRPSVSRFPFFRTEQNRTEQNFIHETNFSGQQWWHKRTNNSALQTKHTSTALYESLS